MQSQPSNIAHIATQQYELVAIDSLKPHPKNARKSDEGALDASIAENGFYGAVVAQRSTGYVLAGWHRTERARVAGIATIPVLFLECSPEMALRIMAADNRTSDLGGYDEIALAELLESVSHTTGGLQGTGFDQAAFDAVIKQAGDALLAQSGEVPDPEPQIDRAAELQKKFGTERGQLWIIGDHRLLCGDSTSVEDVNRLMDGKKAGLMATDPPYGVGLRLEDNHEASNSAKGVKKSYRHFEKIMGDDLEGDKLQAFLEQCFSVAIPVLNDNAAWYLWHAQLSQGFFAAAAAAQLLVHRQIIWVKPHFVFGRGDYHWQHELCFYGWRKGHRPPFYGERNQSTTWMLGEGGGSIRKDQNHPTQKPVELFARPISNHLRRGEIAFEPFAGSGSQFVAAENATVCCYGLEVDPGYTAVILQRMSDMGLHPTLAAKDK